jgi:putative nucleotidyltransferase with HDIG domain
MPVETGTVKMQQEVSLSDVIETEMEERFCHVEKDHPAIRELYEYAVTVELESMEGKTGKDLPSRVVSHRRQRNSLLEREGPALGIDPQEIVRQTVHLPSLPSIFGQLVDLMSDPSSSSGMFAQVIQKDTAISARLLKLVNSPYYGFPSRVETISRAITLVGTKELCALTLAMSVVTLFKDIPEGVVNMKSFWKHSLACGLVARMLAEKKGDADSEPLFVGGLLHDIGRLVLYMQFPEESKNALSRALSGHFLLFGLEHKLFGFDHAELGGMLLKHWGLPLRMADMVGHHHRPEKAVDPLSAGILHLADIAVNAVAIGTSGERYVPPLRDESWKALHIPAGTLKDVLERSGRQTDGLSSHPLFHPLSPSVGGGTFHPPPRAL